MSKYNEKNYGTCPGGCCKYGGERDMYGLPDYRGAQLRQYIENKRYPWGYRDRNSPSVSRGPINGLRD